MAQLARSESRVMTTIVPRISLIVARGRNNVIGTDGDLPWHLGSDFKLFKAVTAGKPVIMGRKTWESLPRKPLPGRLNIVVTRSGGYHAEGARVTRDLGEAFDAAFIQVNTDGVEEVCVIGGAQIYAATIDQADRLYITEVDATPDGSILFPDFDIAQWTETAAECYEAGPVDDHAFVFRTLDRKR
jgi:dihydrofolate reductase